jgi:hypothetical protein
MVGTNDADDDGDHIEELMAEKMDPDPARNGRPTFQELGGMETTTTDYKEQSNFAKKRYTKVNNRENEAC